MGVMPVKKLIITMSLPMMVSMLVQALYNVVDSIFVARLSENALTAVTLAFPLQNLMIAVGSGTGVGVNALLSRALGEKKFKRADKAANMALLLSFCNFLIFVVVGLFISGVFIRSQTADPEIAAMGTTYLKIVNGLSIGLMFQMMFERLLQSTGRTMQSMVSQMTGAIINIILDPIMIFGYFGLPAMGVAGAALATVIGQITAAVIGLVLNLRTNADIHFSIPGILTPDFTIIGKIYQVGVPSILMMSIGSLMTYMMNRILIVFSTTATAVFGVYFKLQSFFFMPVFGLHAGGVDHAGRDSRVSPVPEAASGLLQRIRGHACARRAGASHHQLELSARGLRHCDGIDLPGILEEHQFPDRLGLQADRGSDPGSLAAREDGLGRQRLVVVPDLGGDLAGDLGSSLQEAVSGDRESDVNR